MQSECPFYVGSEESRRLLRWPRPSEATAASLITIASWLATVHERTSATARFHGIKAGADDNARFGAKQQIFYHAINVAFFEFVFCDQPERALALAEELDKLFTPGARQLNRIFVSYSHRDKAWMDRLHVMAKPYLRQAEAELDLLVDTRLQPGDMWRTDIARALQIAGVAVALVSADFLASDFVWQHEMPEILDATERQPLRLLWGYLSPAGWEETALKDIQAAHDTGAH